jgi:hypothetical protein
MSVPANHRRARWPCWVGALGAIVLIYVAGIGPISRLDVPGWQTIYRPMFALGEFRPIGRLLAGYLNQWIAKGSSAVYVYDPDDGVCYQCGFTLDPTPGRSK